MDLNEQTNNVFYSFFIHNFNALINVQMQIHCIKKRCKSLSRFTFYYMETN